MRWFDMGVVMPLIVASVELCPRESRNALSVRAMTNTEPVHDHRHEFDPQQMEAALAHATGVRREIEGIQLRLECARIAVQAEGSIGVRDIMTLARQIHDFVYEAPKTAPPA